VVRGPAEPVVSDEGRQIRAGSIGTADIGRPFPSSVPFLRRGPDRV